jgi:integrase
MTRHFVPGHRPAKLKPILTKSGWMINLTPNMSSTGKRRRLFFHTEREATVYAKQIVEDRREFGDLLNAVTQHQLSDAVRAFELLQPHGIPILQAVTGYLDSLKSQQQGKTFAEVFDAYGNLPGRTDGYNKSIRHVRASLGHLMDRPFSDITVRDFELAFRDLPPGTKTLRIRRLRNVLSYAVKKHIIEADQNHATALDVPKAKVDEISIYTPDQIESLLRAAAAHDKGLIPFLAIASFCGLRPEREAFHLDWSCVHLDEGKPEIVVSAALSKTRRRRFVDISPNCVEWLKAAGVPMVGRVCPYSESHLGKRRKQNRSQAGVPMIPDALRHTYCSAWLAMHGDVNRLLIQSGHTSTSILFRHYYRAMPKDQAEAFWSIRP